jgi:hypothetical protein
MITFIEIYDGLALLTKGETQNRPCFCIPGRCAVIPKGLCIYCASIRSRIDYASTPHRLRVDCTAITNRLHIDGTSMPRQGHINCASIAHRLRSDFETLRIDCASNDCALIPHQLRINCASILHHLRGDCTAIAQRFQSDSKVIAKRLRSDSKTILN